MDRSFIAMHDFDGLTISELIALLSEFHPESRVDVRVEYTRGWSGPDETEYIYIREPR